MNKLAELTEIMNKNIGEMFYLENDTIRCEFMKEGDGMSIQYNDGVYRFSVSGHSEEYTDIYEVEERVQEWVDWINE